MYLTTRGRRLHVFRFSVSMFKKMFSFDCSTCGTCTGSHEHSELSNWTDQFWLPYFRVPDTTAVLDHSVQYGRNSRRYHKEVYMCLYVERRRVFGDSELCARSRRNAGDRR